MRLAPLARNQNIATRVAKTIGYNRRCHIKIMAPAVIGNQRKLVEPSAIKA